MYRMLLRRGKPGEVKGFDPRRFAAVLNAAHARLGGAIVLVWDNDRRHLSAAMRSLIDARPWLTVFSPARLCAGAEPGRGRVVGAQARFGQPRASRHRRTRRSRRHQAQTNKDYEYLPATSENTIYLAMASPLLHRLTRASI
ncbi:hypothetical protein [Streptosporangium roseum]|uniref:hypothetical protein n=1 Tax=Streptosporangium roseum TaxID=2001 RepID=UPI001FE127E9|nr:hypothetical protein [Streptosporangium roseum]